MTTTETAIVKSSLEELLSSHESDIDFSCVDDIVLSYVCGVVEEIASGDEEEVDSSGMKDVMSAYIPSFDSIPEQDVETWVKLMVQKILDEKKKDQVSRTTFEELVNSIPSQPPKVRSSSSSDSSERVQKLSETSSSSEEMVKITKEEVDPYCEALHILMELFPSTCSIEAQHCYSACGGSLEEATSMLLERRDAGTDIKEIAGIKPTQRVQKVVDDATVRSSIFDRYGFVDNDDDRKEHRPVAPKWEGKKLIRYRDNKVVSLKGERFTEVKKEESEELKKTYVNLKPGKQYRFH